MCPALLATYKNAYFLPPTLSMTGPVRNMLATNENAYFLPPTLRMTGLVRSCWPPIRKCLLFAANIEDDWPP